MKRSVLFLCTGNSCRSQMAEGWLRHLAGDRFDVTSAGTHPVGMNPMAVKEMKEVGIDISHHHSKSIEKLKDQAFDVVITVCDQAKESCPVFPHAPSLLHWSFEDPASVTGTEEERLIVFRRVRDQIARCIQQFIKADSIIGNDYFATPLTVRCDSVRECSGLFARMPLEIGLAG